MDAGEELNLLLGGLETSVLNSRKQRDGFVLGVGIIWNWCMLI